MKSDNSIGVMFGVLSWGVLFSFLIWRSPDSNPPSPGCAYCERESNAQSENKTDGSGILPTMSGSDVFIGSKEALIQARNAEHNEYHRLKATFEHRRIEPNWWQTYVAIAACAVAIGQAVLFLIQLRKMDQSLIDAQSTSRAELRPYVSISPKEISVSDISTHKFICRFECINHGKTPAKDVEYRTVFGVTMWTQEEFKSIESSAWYPKHLNLFPSASGSAGDRGDISCDLFHNLSPEVIDLIRQECYFMYVGIEIQYWDFALNSGHKTRNYFRIGGHPTALAILTRDEKEMIEITDLPSDKLRPQFFVIPGLNLIT